MVTWEPGDDGGDPQWFLVDHAKKGDEFSGDSKNASNSNTYEIGGLTSGTEYSVIVYSGNMNGLNEDGKTATKKTTGDYK